MNLPTVFTISVRTLVITILCTATLLWAASGKPEKQSNGAQVRTLNDSLLERYAQLQMGAGSETWRAQTVRLIRQRNSELAALIEQNPQEALRMAFPSDVL